MKTTLTLTLLASLVLTACGGSNTHSPTPLTGTGGTIDNGTNNAGKAVKIESLKGTTTRRAAGSTENQLVTLVAHNNDFASLFYRQQLIKADDANLVISPFSISSAFAMLYLGSANETKQEMGNTLHFNQEDEVFHQSFNTLSQSLLSQENSKDFTVNIVNAQWGEKTYDFNQDYLNGLSKFYDADLKVADIKGQPDKVRQAANAWVAGQTNELIKDLLPENAINVDSRLVLTNAVYLKAKWLHEFHPSKTVNSRFSPLTGEDIQVPTMSQRGDFKGFEEDGDFLIELPYKNTDWSMYFISTSKDKFAEFEADFDEAKFDDMMAKSTVNDSEVFLPKFSFGTDINLYESLKSMGMTLAFNSSAADFSPINQRNEMELYIQAAFHKAFIKVDETGTEASAATGVVAGVESMPTQYRFNQPFLFIIKHKPSNTNLFMGRVTNPLDE